MKIGLGIGLNNKRFSGGAAAPVNTVAPIVTGTAVVGQTLSTTDGTWTGIPTPTYSYQWYRGASAISGATNNTYTLVQADAGNISNIKCVVTATNSAGSASADSNTVAQILTVRTNAFMTASGISDATIRGGLNTFDIGLISNSLDTKMQAVYPIVGGTASTHKWNFMDARDLDVAFRLTFGGTWSHSANGADPNGTNAYANTFFTPSVILGLNSVSLGYYSRESAANSLTSLMGSFVNTAQEIQLLANFSGFNTLFDSYSITAGSGRVSGNSVNYLGFTQASRQSSTSSKLYKNGAEIASITSSSGSQPNIPIYIAAGNVNGTASTFTSYECAFAYISDGLNDTEISNLNTLVTNLQTTLSRNV